MEFNFPSKQGTGLKKLLTNVDKETVDFLYKLLAYDPNDRPTAE
jgi:renal tumor antigen